MTGTTQRYQRHTLLFPALTPEAVRALPPLPPGSRVLEVEWPETQPSTLRIVWEAPEDAAGY